MIHPSDLLRSDSRSKQFIAPVNLQGQSENDWGIHMLPCLAKVFSWKKFAKPLLFTIILSLIGFVQGFLLFYFRNTSEIWSKQYGISRGTSGERLKKLNYSQKNFFIKNIVVVFTKRKMTGYFNNNCRPNANKLALEFVCSDPKKASDF